jgi:hypothetical protein
VTSIEVTLKAAIDAGVTIIQPLIDAFDGIRQAIQWVIDKITGPLTSALEAIESVVPDWAIPGSPTPLEIGLRGIGKEMGKLSQLAMPALTSSFTALNQAQAPLISGAQTTNDYTLNVYTNADAENVQADFETMRAWNRSI